MYLIVYYDYIMRFMLFEEVLTHVFGKHNRFMVLI